MSVCGQDFYEFATKAITFGDEIAYRNTIARSYYAMYHEVLGTLEHCPTFASSVHSSLIAYLNAAKTPEAFEVIKLRSLAAMLKQQKAKRCISDYELMENVTESDAKESLLFAQKLFDKCHEMRSLRASKVS
ncbi:hypothetical protein [Aeromonas hydrophila]|uniref:hypothetical protein n=1 Tax=Aeromonas hydrophila TaxID=644 RepID=UPI0010722A11|nr:hypothetical protein [Aeromonas hydrophila]